MVVYVYTPSRNLAASLVPSYDEQTGKWTAAFQTNEYAVTGSWKVSNISIVDRASNRKTYYNITDYNENFVLDGNTKSDIEAPIITKVEFDKETYRPGDTVNISVTAADDSSGIEYMVVYVYTPSGNLAASLVPSYDEQTGKWTAAFQTNEYAMTGSWKVSDIRIFDHASNRKTFTNLIDYMGNFSIKYNSLETLQVKGHLDYPEVESILNGKYNVKGWFLDGSGVSKVEVLVDGVVNGTATYGTERTDVKNAYPLYDNGNAGFIYALDTTKLSNGSHTISVRAVSYDEKIITVPSKSITVSN